MPDSPSIAVLLTNFAATLAGAEDDTADLLRRHRASLFPSVGLNYEEPIELRRGEGQYVSDAVGRQYLSAPGR